MKNSIFTARNQMGITGRRTVSLSEKELVTFGRLASGHSLPLLVQPAIEGLNLSEWVTANKQLVDSQLLKDGAILFRGFQVSVDQFRQFMLSVAGELLTYHERSSPRSEVGESIYTSTEYPANLSIFPHNENSYAQSWPMKLSFHCAVAASEGGETPIADVRQVYRNISSQVRERFEEKGWLLVRNFGDGIGLSWQEVFQTLDKAVVESHCRRHGIAYEWKTGDRLRTRQVRQTTARHPRTGDLLWFNHAAFFHVSTLEPTISELLLDEFAEEDLPNNTYYGDGTPIEPPVLAELRNAYERELVFFEWCQGDVLLLDNMLTAHGRAPFKGVRKILVAMAEPFSNRNI